MDSMMGAIMGAIGAMGAVARLATAAQPSQSWSVCTESSESVSANASSVGSEWSAAPALSVLEKRAQSDSNQPGYLPGESGSDRASSQPEMASSSRDWPCECNYATARLRLFAFGSVLALLRFCFRSLVLLHLKLQLPILCPNSEGGLRIAIIITIITIFSSSLYPFLLLIEPILSNT